jgi:plastocyanin
MRRLLTPLMLVALVAAAVALPACGGSSSSPAGPTPTPTPASSADVVITIRGESGGMSFSPNPAAVKVGQTVSWHNADSITHTATQNAGAFDTGSVPPGATSAPVRLMNAGAFDYHCSIHPSMVGTVNVN